MCLTNTIIGLVTLLLLIQNYKLTKDSVFLLGIPLATLPSLNCLTLHLDMGLWFFLSQATTGVLVTLPIKTMRLTTVNILYTILTIGLSLLNLIYAVVSLTSPHTLNHYSTYSSVLWLTTIGVLLLGGVKGNDRYTKPTNRETGYSFSNNTSATMATKQFINPTIEN